MGIREEIEWRAAHTVLDCGRDQEVFDRTIKDVLSILDEWEYVREGKVDFEEFRPEGEDSTFICCLLDDTVLGIILKYSRRVKPGDHIAIYMRRKDEHANKNSTYRISKNSHKEKTRRNS